MYDMTPYMELVNFKKKRLKMNGRKDKTLHDYYYDIISDPNAIMFIPNEIIKKLIKEYEFEIVGGDNSYYGLFIGRERVIPRLSRDALVQAASDRKFSASIDIGGNNIIFNKIVVIYRVDLLHYKLGDGAIYVIDCNCDDPTCLSAYIPAFDTLYRVKFDALHYELRDAEVIGRRIRK